MPAHGLEGPSLVLCLYHGQYKRTPSNKVGGDLCDFLAIFPPQIRWLKEKQVEVFRKIYILMIFFHFLFK